MSVEIKRSDDKKTCTITVTVVCDPQLGRDDLTQGVIEHHLMGQAVAALELARGGVTSQTSAAVLDAQATAAKAEIDKQCDLAKTYIRPTSNIVDNPKSPVKK